MDAAAFIALHQQRPWSVERHCWCLVEDAQRAVMQRELPAVAIGEDLTPLQLARLFRDHPERRRWRRVPAPVHGAIVLMQRAGAGRAHAQAIHAGVYFDVDRGGILHVDGGHHTEFLDLFTLTTLRNWRCDHYVPGER